MLSWGSAINDEIVREVNLKPAQALFNHVYKPRFISAELSQENSGLPPAPAKVFVGLQLRSAPILIVVEWDRRPHLNNKRWSTLQSSRLDLLEHLTAFSFSFVEFIWSRQAFNALRKVLLRDKDARGSLSFAD